MLSSVLTAHGEDAAAEPHPGICLGGPCSIGPCQAAQCPCPAGRGCRGAGRQWGAQAGRQCFLCPRACYPKANASEQGGRGAGTMIHFTSWVLLAEILSSVAKRRAPTLLSHPSWTEQAHGGVETACPGAGCCRHRAVTHFATRDSGVDVSLTSGFGSSSFSCSRAFAPAQHSTGWWPSTHGPGLLLCL